MTISNIFNELFLNKSKSKIKITTKKYTKKQPKQQQKKNIKIKLQNQTINIIFEVSKKIKYTKVFLLNKNTVLIKHYRQIGDKEIEEIILNHKIWILKNLVKMRQTLNIDKQIIFLGDIYNVVIDRFSDEVCKIDINLKKYILNNNYSKCKQKDILKLFYKQNAQKLLKSIIISSQDKTKLNANKISYRYATSRWGSCSYKNNISLNYMMMQFPLSFAKYVVLHEFCHIKHKNHSKQFWQFLGSFMNDYKTIITKTQTYPIVDMRS